jgi:SLBB domain
MRSMKALLIATLILIALSPSTSRTHSFAQQPGQISPCPRVTQEEVKRRYPTEIRVTPEHIYVVGSVNKPGAIKYEKGMTVTRSIELAGGLTPDANRRVRILKVRAGEPAEKAEKPIELNLEAIARKQVTDVVLEGGYVITVESGCPLPPLPRRPYPQMDPPPSPLKNPLRSRDVKLAKRWTAYA